MGKFSFLTKGFSGFKNLFKGTSALTEAVSSGTKVITKSKTVTKVLTWGNAFKVGIAGAIGYWILGGGLVSSTASALGIPTWMASVFWVLIFGVVVYLLLTFLSGWIRSKTGVKRHKPSFENKVRSAPSNYYNNKKKSYNKRKGGKK